MARWPEAISSEARDELNVALKEATWIGAEVDLASRLARLEFDALSLPLDGAASAGSRVTVAVSQVNRVAASLRMGWWNDEAAEVVPLEIADLDATVRSFGGCPIYGWEFIDPPEESWVHWRDGLSVDIRLQQGESPMSLTCSREAVPSIGTWTSASVSRDPGHRA